MIRHASLLFYIVNIYRKIWDSKNLLSQKIEKYIQTQINHR